MENVSTSKYYDTISASYNKLYGEEQLEKYNSCKSLIPKTGLILDAGCGTGIITAKMKNVIGVDSSIGQLLQCDKSLRVVCADIEELPFKNSSFDTIVSFSVLQDINNISKAIKEFKRVLKKDGHVVISVLNKNRVETARAEIKKNFKNVKEKIVRNDVVFYN